jgi:ABC-type multidrug transport system fused ATPase/permease subunit
VLIIAHRLSSVRECDRILVLENGRLVEQGAHNELLTNDDGIYARLYRMQAA